MIKITSFFPTKSKFQIFFKWLTSAGLTLLLITTLYDYFFGSMNIEFIQSIDNQYEFFIKNNFPFDRQIRDFRIKVPPQNMIYEITEDIHAIEKPNGIELPGGNTAYVPAAETREIDGRLIRGHSKEKIIIPPLSSQRWLKPTAFVASISFESQPKNYLLRKLEKILVRCHLVSANKFVQNYNIVNNYWRPTQKANTNEAITIACRENDSLAMRASCPKRY